MKRTLSALFLAVVFFAPQVQAGMIATEAAAQEGERGRLNTMLERSEVVQQFEKMGIAASEAKERVAAMTDAEVAAVAGRIDSAIAAGAMSNTDLIIVLLLVLLILVVI